MKNGKYEVGDVVILRHGLWAMPGDYTGNGKNHPGHMGVVKELHGEHIHVMFPGETMHRFTNTVSDYWVRPQHPPYAAGMDLVARNGATGPYRITDYEVAYSGGTCSRRFKVNERMTYTKEQLDEFFAPAPKGVYPSSETIIPAAPPSPIISAPKAVAEAVAVHHLARTLDATSLTAPRVSLTEAKAPETIEIRFTSGSWAPVLVRAVEAFGKSAALRYDGEKCAEMSVGVLSIPYGEHNKAAAEVIVKLIGAHITPEKKAS